MPPKDSETFAALVGVTLTRIEGAEADNELIELHADDGRVWVLWHEQDCCEDVYIESVVGDVADLIGTPIVLAEVVLSDTAPEGSTFTPKYNEPDWTFYKLATVRGYVTIRWVGESHYYSTEVSVTVREPPAPAPGAS